MIRRCLLLLATVGLVANAPAPRPPVALTQVRPTPQQAPQSWSLVHWKPLPQNPVFTGTGHDTWDRKIRERGYILPVATEAMTFGTPDMRAIARPRCRLAMPRHPMASIGRETREIPYSPDRGSRICASCTGRTYFMFAEGKNDIAHLLKSTDGRTWIDHGALDIRKLDGKPIEPRPIRHANRVVREWDVVSLL